MFLALSVLARPPEWYPPAALDAKVEYAMLGNFNLSHASMPLVVPRCHRRLTLEHDTLAFRRPKSLFGQMSTGWDTQKWE